MTPKQLANHHGRIPKTETIGQAARRAAKFAGAMIDAGHEEMLTEGMAGSKLDAENEIADVAKALAALGKTAKPTAAALKVIARAEARHAKLANRPVPATVKELWQVLGDRAYGTWLRGFCIRALVDPKQLISPPPWAEGSSLACISDGDGASDTRERFDNEYVGWFAKADPKTKISTPAALLRRKPGPRSGVMLDPALAETIISIAWWHSEDWFVVGGLAAPKLGAPVFSHHDDGEGFSTYLATDVRGWISAEVSASMLAIVDYR